MKANESFDPEVTRRRKNATPRPGSLRSGDARRRVEVIDSWMLVAESKRLLLYVLERRFQLHHRAEDLVSIERARTELDLAERRYLAERNASPVATKPTAALESTYANMIRLASTTAAQVSRNAARLHPADRLSAAVRVQMLDELLDHWRRLLGREAPGET